MRREVRMSRLATNFAICICNILRKELVKVSLASTETSGPDLSIRDKATLLGALITKGPRTTKGTAP